LGSFKVLSEYLLASEAGLCSVGFSSPVVV